MMIHCPNNQHCPPFARRFHDELRRRSATALPPLPDWPFGPDAEQPPLFPS